MDILNRGYHNCVMHRCPSKLAGAFVLGIMLLLLASSSRKRIGNAKVLLHSSIMSPIELTCKHRL